jgi:hypothetical protein
LTNEESYDPKAGIKTRITYETKVVDQKQDPTLDRAYEITYKVITKLKTETKRVPKSVAERKVFAAA